MVSLKRAMIAGAFFSLDRVIRETHPWECVDTPIQFDIAAPRVLALAQSSQGQGCSCGDEEQRW